MWKMRSPSIVVTMLCAALFIAHVASAPQPAERPEDQSVFSSQATEEDLEDLIKVLEANGVELSSLSALKILPELLHHQAAYHPYQRKRSNSNWPWLQLQRPNKRNAELINSLLGLPRMMKVVGKK